MKILITFTGFHDPYSEGVQSQKSQAGPILTLVQNRPFDQVYLLSTPQLRERTEATASALSEVAPEINHEILPFNLPDPIDYGQILRETRKHWKALTRKHKGADFSVCVSSGTPQMHSCWLLLVTTGEVKASILNLRPPRFVTRDQPLITELDPRRMELVSSTEKIEITTSDLTNPETVRQKIGIIGESPSMRAALERAYQFARSPLSVLILGETGTGKELFAKLIHHLSDRRDGPLETINCGAIPEGLEESVLFGHKKGSFTGATQDQKGAFELASGGTLFLDEVGELPIKTQVKLLRAIQEGEIKPLGSSKTIKVDGRIIAATNRDLKKSVEKSFFREDLYYRLNVGTIELPPLRDRKDDIPKLALHLLEQINKSLPPRQFYQLTPGALKTLQKHSWPGNVRELFNTLERACALSQSQEISPSSLQLNPQRDVPVLSEVTLGEEFSLSAHIDQIRSDLMDRALEQSDGNKSQAARLLGIKPQAVHQYFDKKKEKTKEKAKKSRKDPKKKGKEK